MANGHAELSPRKDIDTSKITDPLLASFAELLASSDVFRFDGADQMPGAVGSGTFWTEATAWIVGGSTDDMLNNIERELARQLITRMRREGPGLRPRALAHLGVVVSVHRWWIGVRAGKGDEMVQAFGQVIILVAIFLGFLLGLYALTRFLPGAWRERGQVFVFVAPAVLLVFAGLFVPAVRTIVASFRDDKGKKWLGFDNFHEIFVGKDTRLILFNTFTWVIGGTVFVVIVALAVARFADGMRGEKVAKSLIFIPAAIALAGAGIIWKFIYAGPPFKVGLANQAAKAIPGLPASLGGNGDKIWLVDRNIGGITPPSTAPGMNTFLLIVIFVWASTGLATVIFSAAIKGVPSELIEAARVDGATKRQTFYKVTLPYISVTVVTVATITAIAGLKVFDIVAATTGGNFGTSTVANEFYRVYFVQNRLGFGSAYAVLLFLLVIPVVVMNRRAQQRAEERS